MRGFCLLGDGARDVPGQELGQREVPGAGVSWSQGGSLSDLNPLPYVSVLRTFDPFGQSSSGLPVLRADESWVEALANVLAERIADGRVLLRADSSTPTAPLAT